MSFARRPDDFESCRVVATSQRGFTGMDGSARIGTDVKKEAACLAQGDLVRLADAVAGPLYRGLAGA